LGRRIARSRKSSAHHYGDQSAFTVYLAPGGGQSPPTAARRASPPSSREGGWQYVIHDWTTVIEEVFDRHIAADEMETLAHVAAFARPAR